MFAAAGTKQKNVHERPPIQPFVWFRSGLAW
jgi:hypothetical protein